MVGGNDIELPGQRIQTRLVTIESLRAVQEQERLTLAATSDIDLAAPDVDEGVLRHFPPPRARRCAFLRCRSLDIIDRLRIGKNLAAAEKKGPLKGSVSGCSRSPRIPRS